MSELADERDFLLRSLADLDRERDDGNLDDAQYATLHADYTARAAGVLRAIERGESAATVRPPADRRSRRRAALVWSGVIAFAVLAAVSLSFALGARLPGQLASGNVGTQGGGGQGDAIARLEAAVQARPDDPAPHRALARAYLSQRAYAKALEQFDAVVRIVPDDVEAHAYGGWIVRLAGLPDEGLQRIQRAVDLDASYPDAHFFRGIIYLRDKGDPAAAIPEFQLYLAARPDGAQSDAVRQLLAGAVAATSGGVPSTTTTPR